MLRVRDKDGSCVLVHHSDELDVLQLTDDDHVLITFNTMGRGTVQRRRRKSAKRRRADLSEEMDGSDGRTMLTGTAGANATWVRTGRRGSDTYLEVLPDLTKGVDEQQTWEELQEVRCQPISLSEKRKLKRQLLSAPTLRTRGWQAVHLSRRKLTKRWGDRMRAWLAQLELWRTKLRYVEGNFGTGLVALFSFIKWLLFLNLFMSAVIVTFILLPQLFFVNQDPCLLPAWENTSESITTAPYNMLVPSVSPSMPPTSGCCHVPYRDGVEQRVLESLSMELHEKIVAYLLQVLQGTGILEYSPIFYGFYTRETLQQTWGNMEVQYELPLAYLSVMILLMAFCLLVMVKKAAKGLRESLKSTEGEFYQFCNIIFGGWDFCIENTKAAYVKHKAIYNEFCTHLEAERFREEKELRTRKQRLVLCLVRLLINMLVLAIIVGAFVLVWYVTTFSFAQLEHARASPTAEHLRSYASPLTSENATVDLVDPVSEGTEGANYSHFITSIRDDPLTTWASFPSASVRRATTDASTTANTANSRSSDDNVSYALDGVMYDELEPSRSNAEINSATSSTNSRSSSSRAGTIDDASFASEGTASDEPGTGRNFESSGAADELQSTAVSRTITTASVNTRTTSLFSVNSDGDDVSSEGTEEPASTDELHPMLMLVYRYLPPATIVTLNIFVPFIFNQLVVWERYSTSVVLRITLMRTVVLRLSSLGVLLYTLHNYTTKCPPTVHRCVSPECEGQVLCWETYVGQELYKLTLLDLAVMAFNTFFVNLLRKIVGQHLLQRTSFGRRVGAVEFEIPKHVLDIVYGQTLCWLGMFYAPLLPLITSCKLVLVFYIKYFDCSVNSRQSSQFYRTSRSNALFISILLISFIVTIIPVGYSIVDLTPSVGCGPFRGLDAIWAQMVKLISELPEWIQSVVFFLGTAGFAVPTIVLLSLAGYYYYAVAAANQQLVLMLKGQLVLEGHDKQFLLNRLDMLIKRVNEEERRRSRRDYSDVSAGGSNDLTLQIGASR
ncbi:TMC protein [Trinorchestia longiramus]|nr:TMC protein [Trinorchestia longiramus]